MKTHTQTAWTAPYYGVQHLQEAPNSQYRATVEAFGSFARLSYWFPGCGFSPICSDHASAGEALEAGEKYMEAHLTKALNA